MQSESWSDSRYGRLSVSLPVRCGFKLVFGLKIRYLSYFKHYIVTVLGLPLCREKFCPL